MKEMERGCCAGLAMFQIPIRLGISPDIRSRMDGVSASLNILIREYFPAELAPGPMRS